MKTIHASAPGRVNLIGDHTDYNLGYVLPIALPQRTFVEISLRDDELVIAESENFAAKVQFTLGQEERTGDWADYVRGLTSVLRQENFLLQGMEIRIRSDLPVGSGLSSSAALSVALLRGFITTFRLGIGDLELARLCQKAENEFVGARVGILDPMACHLADQNTALFLDTKSMEYARIPIPFDLADLLVVSSGIVHHNAAETGYNQRRKECEQAARLLGVSSLREISVLPVGNLPDVLEKRVRHVVSENERVLEAVESFRRRDLERLGQVFNDSHRSLRDDYEVSLPEIDQMVAAAQSDPRVYGARLTGGGFGGSFVAFTKKGEAADVGRDLLRSLQRELPHAKMIVPTSQDQYARNVSSSAKVGP